jgi:hypothetical protein
MLKGVHKLWSLMKRNNRVPLVMQARMQIIKEERAMIDHVAVTGTSKVPLAE